MKICSKCKSELSIDDFYHDKTRKDGHYHTCKKCSDKERRRREKTPAGRLRVYKHSAKKRDRIFDLTKEEFMSFWDKDCYYCGNKVNGIGLDRVDNGIGYTIDNVVSCCYACNRMKGNLSQDSFIEHIKQVLKNYLDN